MPGLPISEAHRIESYCYNPEDVPDPNADVFQTSHRIRILNAWDAIHEGSRVLEIGCGQGNCTIVLADAVGASGKVDALDPAPPDYGAPVTLEQAQGWISQSAVGPRITWHQATPEKLLADTADQGTTWDVAVLTHCIWYFKSPDAFKNILQALRGRVKKVCVAEYALKATEPAALPHVLAALTRAALESQRDSSENIQNIETPTSIKAMARDAGWTLTDEATVVPEMGLHDGFWETNTVHSTSFLEDVDLVKDERLAAYLRASREAVISATAAHGDLRTVQTMDVWLGTFQQV